MDDGEFCPLRLIVAVSEPPLVRFTETLPGKVPLISAVTLVLTGDTTDTPVPKVTWPLLKK